MPFKTIVFAVYSPYPLLSMTAFVLVELHFIHHMRDQFEVLLFENEYVACMCFQDFVHISDSPLKCDGCCDTIQ